MRFSLSSLLALTFVLGSLGTLYNTWDSWQVTKRLHIQDEEELKWLYLSPDGKYLSALYQKIRSVEFRDPKTKEYQGALLPQRIYVWSYPEGILKATFDTVLNNPIKRLNQRWVQIPDGNSSIQRSYLDLDTHTTFPLNIQLNGADLSYDGTILALHDLWSTVGVKLLDAKTEKVLEIVGPIFHKGVMDRFWYFIPNDSRYYWLSREKEISVWNRSGTITTYPIPYDLNTYKLRFTPPSNLMLLTNSNFYVTQNTIVDLNKRVKDRIIWGTPAEQLFSPNGRWMVTHRTDLKAGEYPTLNVWDLESSTPQIAFTIDPLSYWVNLPGLQTNWIYEKGRLIDPSSRHSPIALTFPAPVAIQRMLEDGKYVWVQPTAGKASHDAGTGGLEMWETEPKLRLIFNYGDHTPNFASHPKIDAFAAEQSLGDLVIWSKMRPEPLWGIVWLPAFWTTLITLGFLGWCVRKDFKGLCNKR